MQPITPTRHYLSIDQGGHASRAILFDGEGDIVSQAACEIGTLHPQAFYVEHDPVELIASINKAISDCLGQLDTSIHITAAGLATQRSSIMCWDRITGEPLSNVISWQDRRAAAWMQQFSSNKNEIHDITGLFTSPHYGVSKIVWCLEHLPRVKNALDNGSLIIGPLASYIAYQVCQEHPLYSDPANGSRTLLYDISTKNWSGKLLQLFGIPQNILPQCTPSRFDFGTIAAHKQSIPLTTVTGDQSAALFHDGLPETNAAYINIGTGAFIQRIVDKPVHDCPNLLSSIVYSAKEQDYYALEGTVNGAGSAISWFEENVSSDSDWKRHFDKWLENPANDLFFINAVGGIASPYWLSDIKPQFIGEGSTAEKFCALIESILFLIMKNLQTMNEYLAAPEKLIISGGFSRSDTLCQRLADLTMIPVQRPEEQEATAKGLCFLLINDKAKWKTGEISSFAPKTNKEVIGRYQHWLTLIN